MTAVGKSSDDPPPASLERLIIESGNRAGPRIADFISLASAAERERDAVVATRPGAITRSTALWTTMELDAGIRKALEQCGIQQKGLRDALAFQRSPSSIPTTDAILVDRN